MHDAGDQSESASAEVLVESDEVGSEGVAGEEDFLLEGFVGGGLGLLDDFPVEQHDFAEGVGLVLDGDDVGDDVHDDGGVGVVGDHALDQVFDCGYLLVEGACGDAAFELLEVGGVFAGFEEDGAHAHIDVLCVAMENEYDWKIIGEHLNDQGKEADSCCFGVIFILF